MTPANTAAEGLEALGAHLSARGFITTVMQGGGPPCVHVVSSETTHLAENIYAAPAADGSLWFWWSWAERLAPIRDVATAADRLAAVLRVRPETAHG